MKSLTTANSRLTVEITQISFYDADSGFTIAHAVFNDKAIAVVGYFNGGVPGEVLEASGYWRYLADKEPQFYAESFTKTLPVTTNGIVRYLSSGVICGLNEALVKAMTETFDAQVFDVLNRNDESLMQLPGLNANKRRQITASWQKRQKIQALAEFLLNASISPVFAASIYNRLGEDALNQIKLNPFILVHKIQGFGFMPAVRMARYLNINCDDLNYAEYGLMAMLHSLADKGHTYYPYPKLLNSAIKKLGLKPGLMAEAIARCAARGEIVLKDLNPAGRYFMLNNKAVYLLNSYICEKDLAQVLKRLLNAFFAPYMQAPQILPQIKALNIDEKLKQHLKTLLSHKCVLVNEPVKKKKRKILEAFGELEAKTGLKITMAAVKINTVSRHSYGNISMQSVYDLLGLNHTTGVYPAPGSTKIDCDVMVVAQASLLDMCTLSRLVLALPDHAVLILTGDGSHLPPTGPGRVFADLMATGLVPVINFNDVPLEREAVLSNAAQKIGKGEMPNMPEFAPFAQNSQNFYFIEQNDIDKIFKTVSGLYAKRLPQTYGLEPLDIQVITLSRKGPLGSKKLNLYLQEKLNKHTKGFKYNGFVFKLKDKVVQTQTNRAKGLYFGQTGIIKNIDLHKKELTVKFDDKLKRVYGLNELSELKPAYAVPASKIFYSKYKAVILPLHCDAYVNLNRTALYSAFLATDNMLIVVGQKRALKIALENYKYEKRYTGLKELLLT